MTRKNSQKLLIISCTVIYLGIVWYYGKKFNQIGENLLVHSPLLMFNVLHFINFRQNLRFTEPLKVFWGLFFVISIGIYFYKVLSGTLYSVRKENIPLLYGMPIFGVGTFLIYSKMLLPSEEKQCFAKVFLVLALLTVSSFLAMLASHA